MYNTMIIVKMVEMFFTGRSLIKLFEIYTRVHFQNYFHSKLYKTFQRFVCDVIFKQTNYFIYFFADIFDLLSS